MDGFDSGTLSGLIKNPRITASNTGSTVATVLQVHAETLHVQWLPLENPSDRVVDVEPKLVILKPGDVLAIPAGDFQTTLELHRDFWNGVEGARPRNAKNLYVLDSSVIWTN